MVMAVYVQAYSATIIMSNSDFLFTSLASKTPNTTRKTHIRRLYDVFQICLHRRDIERAKRAWAILARCPEIHWKTMWATALSVLSVKDDLEQSYEQKIEFLREMMLLQPANKRHILTELVSLLVLSGRSREALDHLEL
jgi:RNA polymerase I-specific transcription initiation factor RRN11